MKFRSIFALTAAAAVAATMLTACGSGDSDGSGTAVSIIAVSGGNIELTGTYKSTCYENWNNGVSTGTYSQETKVFSGNTMDSYEHEFATVDCSGTGTETGSWPGITLSAGATTTISGWSDGMGDPATAPTAADGSGALSANEPYTPLTITYLGQTEVLFFIADDTAVAGGGPIVMYRSSDSAPGTAGINDALHQQL